MRLDLVVGSNGAGKSTFVSSFLTKRLQQAVFINADEIAKREWPDSPEAHSYEAARIAAEARSALIARGDPFIAETVFSHPSKLDLISDAKSAGYVVVLRVLLLSENDTVARVAERVRNGGHSVPEQKVRERYARLWTHVATAIAMVDRATVYDNSDTAGPRVVAQFSGGMPVGAADWPTWTPPALAALGT